MSEEQHEMAIAEDGTEEYLTVFIGGQLFGLNIERVHDVFLPDSITPVPLSSPEIKGVLNLRGRIVTAIDMNRRLNLPENSANSHGMAVGIEYKGESYGLIIDNVGEVLRLNANQIESNPSNLDARWRAISSGVCRLKDKLMLVLDVERTLDFGQDSSAAAT